MKDSRHARRANQLRIIGGKWRGRKLNFPSIEGLRPTGDRIRETLFNWLWPHLEGAHCLDLFAGSGALAFEALSRGAQRVVGVDSDGEVVEQLQYSANHLQCDGFTAIRAAAQDWLRRADTGDRFDIVFLDPPFASALLQGVAEELEHSGVLAADALIYVESGREQAVQLPGNWRQLKSKHAGQVSYALYRRTGAHAQPL